MFTPVTDVHAYERLALQPRLPNVSLRLVTQPVLRVWERKVKEQFDDGFTEAGACAARPTPRRRGTVARHNRRCRRSSSPRASVAVVVVGRSSSSSSSSSSSREQNAPSVPTTTQGGRENRWSVGGAE